MANKLSTIFVLLLILIITFITYWLKIEVEKELLIKNSKNGSGPTFYLKKFDSVQTKKNGDIKFTISAKNMKEFDYAEYLWDGQREEFMKPFEQVTLPSPKNKR